ncbi:ATP-binding protein [Acidithiobacillus ferrooxidans]|uniref:ATP-binding protein n=1 Tax=Acidithiobacillus ferrooxidans TaxID=920 RepID=UPI000A47136D|nr:ATP-binding protein [Acidithiobacillus ferrooxidans]
MNAVVKINVNEKTLISHLKMAFATGTTWVTELLQNARRAGATKIHILLNPDRKEVTIVDDGQGIEDMQHLFSIAESGWDEPVLSDEKPYGMGFLSCLFACEKVHIISQKQQAKVVTKGALAFDDIHVEQHPGVQGTFIRMEGVTNMPSAQFIQSAVKGFPVPVYLNWSTTPLENLHAVDAMDWDETEIGLIHISRLDCRFYDPVFYLQGLPINAGFRHQYADGNVIVHLDSTKFFGRLPDRSSVIDPESTAVAIRSAITHLYEGKLHQKKTEMLANGQAQEFVARYGEVCMTYCKKMLNDVPFFPEAAIGGMVYDLDCNANNTSLSFPANPVSQASVVEKKVTLFSGNDGDYDTENLAHMALIQAYDGIIVRADTLDSEHWVHPYVHHLKSDIRIALTEPQAPFTIYGRFIDGYDVVLGDVLTLSGSFELGGSPVEMERTCDETIFDSKDECFYVPAASKGYRAVGQASDYLEDDVYYEDAFEEDDNLFARLVSEARNPDPAKLLQQLLLDIGLTRYSSLNEQTFQVTIGKDGAVKVTLT